MIQAKHPIITLNVEQVARLLHCSQKTVLEKAGIGEIKGAKIGKAWFFKESDIINYIDEMIAQQTRTRKERYTPNDREIRSYQQPIKRKAGYPDLAPYRHLISS